MKVSVLSGKGGTGKTFVSVNIASLLENSAYIDCDVEEPNGHLFFKPELIKEYSVNVKVPKFDFDKCISCKKCVDSCAFNALAFINDKPFLFSDVCHSCGLCSYICPANAVYEIDNKVGVINYGISKNKVSTYDGIMNIGESSGVPLIKELFKKSIDSSANNLIYDCPPGSGCMVSECVLNSDVCIIVAEATIFGTHNLDMVVRLVSKLNKPFAVVLNKSDEDEINPSKSYCLKNGIKILGEIPFDKNIGLLSSSGVIISEREEYKHIFSNIINNAKRWFK